ncbi:Protein FAR1-RELATED SEQUENCE 7 [Linum perenne]
MDESIMQQHFRLRERGDKNFFYETQDDGEGNIVNIFWADGRMREEYKVFGDSISFDTTYRTNKDYKPQAIFVGYNHHRELVIFRAALLFDEKTETFEWLFKTFEECMRGQKPKSIFTDQAPPIAAGIRTQFQLPATFHGLCTFHIHQNASKNLGSLCDKQFVAELKYLMFGVDDENEFEENWLKMKATCFPGKPPKDIHG